MSPTPREIGTLIVVVLKANHLPNKRHIGKQDPYCVVTVNGEKRRTKAIKRGGQHPEWDEEIRFTLYEETENPEKPPHGNGTPPPPPPKNEKRRRRIKGGAKMKLACYADDPREPDFIGETDVDLTEVLTKGETDEWFTLLNKEKFSGKVYLELTFWSNEPPPEKKVPPKPTKNKQYGGPGSFVPTGEVPSSSTNGAAHPSHAVSVSGMYDHTKQGSDGIPSALRASNSLAKLDLYVPPYERNRASPVDKVANEFGELGLSGNGRRRESFPPQPTLGYEYTDYSNNYTYDRPVTPGDQQPPGSQYLPQPSYHHQYDASTHSTYHQSTIRAPRHSIPTSSSGFVPLPAPSGFMPPAHNQDPLGYPPPASITPSPVTYGSSPYISQPPYAPAPSQSAIASGGVPYLPTAASSYATQPPTVPAPQLYQYPQYTSPTPAPYSHAHPQPLPAPPPQSYTAYAVTTPPQESVIAPLPPQSTQPAASRPLPQQPQIIYGQPSTATAYSAASPSYNPSYTAGSALYVGNNAYASVPPPPPLPGQYHANSQPFPGSEPQQVVSGSMPPPPPPPPLPQTSNAQRTRRQSSLPPPPVVYQQSPPPSDLVQHSTLPPPPPPSLPSHSPTHNQMYPQGGPPPLPPTPPNNTGNWAPPPPPTNYV